jgi:hypothetical protein
MPRQELTGWGTENITNFMDPISDRGKSARVKLSLLTAFILAWKTSFVKV